MSDAGEGLVDAEARLQEQIEAREQERARRASTGVRDPERYREIESFRLAKAQLTQQLQATEHPVRRKQILAAIAEVERRLANV
jgi:hypothetical protein